MTTIYMKSKDGQAVGVIQVNPEAQHAVVDTLAREGYEAITEYEFRQLKAQLLRRMVQPEPARA